MGAGRKKKTLTLKEKAPSQWTVNCSTSARNLRKSELGSVIFGCTHVTFKECLLKQLFGLPDRHFAYVKNVRRGMPLFLFNYSDRKLHGIFQAAGNGQMNIDPYGWTSDCSATTQYPAQVRIEIQLKCQPLTEDQFKPIIAGNYYEQNLFWFELDKTQTNELKSLFSRSPVAQTAPAPHPQCTARWGTLFRRSLAPIAGQASGISGPCDGDAISADARSCRAGRGSFSDVVRYGKVNHEPKISSTQETLEKNGSVGTRFPQEKLCSFFTPSSNSDLKEQGKSFGEPGSELNISCQELPNDWEAYFCAPFDGDWEVATDNNNIDKYEEVGSLEPCSEFPEEISRMVEEVTPVQQYSDRMVFIADALTGEQSETMLEENSSLLPCSDGKAYFDHKLDGREHSETVLEEGSSLLPYSDGTVFVADSLYGGEDSETVAEEENSSHESSMEWGSELVASVCGENLPPKASGVRDATIAHEGQPMPKPLDESSRRELNSEGNSDEDPHSRSALMNTGDTCHSEEMILEIRSSNLQLLLVKLIQEIGEMKSYQRKQSQTIDALEQDLAQSMKEIQELKVKYGLLESMSSPRRGHIKEEELEESLLEHKDLVLIVGGYDGLSWLSALDSYEPSLDLLKSLTPMMPIRSYASAAKLNGELYVFGGSDGSGTVWYNTVESYNPTNGQWVSRPSLNRKKGSLGGASLSNKVFAIGGGDGIDCFSEVEMLDLDIGKWIFTRSMSQKRFAPAVVELNGVLYVVGGYNGEEYLSSMERFDPREHSWTKLASMSTRRGCHSLAVLNEKLYAVGGYDGSRMISSVEVFDPRIDSWMMAKPMNEARGYLGAVTVGNSIYAIGGMRNGNEVSDTVECYSEGNGWQLQIPIPARKGRLEKEDGTQAQEAARKEAAEDGHREVRGNAFGLWEPALNTLQTKDGLMQWGVDCHSIGCLCGQHQRQ
ncbi:hypothetical protein Ancab_034543 [Ancistrocladus abbreviatus]